MKPIRSGTYLVRFAEDPICAIRSIAEPKAKAEGLNRAASPSPVDADGADEKPHAVFLGGEQVLDGGTRLRADSVGALTLRRERPAGRTAQIDLRYPARFGNLPLVLLATAGGAATMMWRP